MQLSDSTGQLSEVRAMLPDLAIPYGKSRSKNQDRYGDATDRCLLCGKPIDLAKSRVVVLTGDLGAIADPETPNEINGGCFDIGSDCWKRNRQLHPYEVKDIPR